MLIGALATSFATGVATSDCRRNEVVVAEQTECGVGIVPAASVAEIAREAGLDDAETAELAGVYADSQIESLHVSLVALIVIAVLSLFFSRGIPTEIAGRPRVEDSREADEERRRPMNTHGKADAGRPRGVEELPPPPTDFAARASTAEARRRLAEVVHAEWVPAARSRRSGVPDRGAGGEPGAGAHADPSRANDGVAVHLLQGGGADDGGRPRQHGRSGITTQICGDAHLSNFGVFGTPEREIVFDINDFDETLPGPWEWDLKRLAASFEVACRYRGFDAAERRGSISRSCAAIASG